MVCPLQAGDKISRQFNRSKFFMLEGRPNVQPSRYLPICGEVGDPNSDSVGSGISGLDNVYLFFLLFVFLKSCEKNIISCANNGRLHAIYLFRMQKCS
jgi:hypothetical protein